MERSSGVRAAWARVPSPAQNAVAHRARSPLPRSVYRFSPLPEPVVGQRQSAIFQGKPHPLALLR